MATALFTTELLTSNHHLVSQLISMTMIILRIR